MKSSENQKFSNDFRDTKRDQWHEMGKEAIKKFRESTKLTSIFRKRTTLFNFKQDMFRE